MAREGGGDTGIPMVVYGILNALDSPDYVQVATPPEGPF
jgi:hypothetical protein